MPSPTHSLWGPEPGPCLFCFRSLTSSLSALAPCTPASLASWVWSAHKLSWAQVFDAALPLVGPAPGSSHFPQVSAHRGVPWAPAPRTMPSSLQPLSGSAPTPSPSYYATPGWSPVHERNAGSMSTRTVVNAEQRPALRLPLLVLSVYWINTWML